MKTIEEIRQNAREAYERTLVHLDRLETYYSKLVTDLSDIDPIINVDSMDVNIHLYGGKAKLDRVFGVLRRLGFSPVERPTEKATEYRSRFTRADGACIYLFFTSTVCHRVQVGTRTVDEPIYEIRCDDQTEEQAA